MHHQRVLLVIPCAPAVVLQDVVVDASLAPDALDVAMDAKDVQAVAMCVLDVVVDAILHKIAVTIAQHLVKPPVVVDVMDALNVGQLVRVVQMVADLHVQEDVQARAQLLI